MSKIDRIFSKKNSFKKSEKQRVHKTTARGRSRVARLNPQIGSGFGRTNLNKSPKCRRSLISMDALMALEFMMLCYFFKDKYDDRREKATCLRHSKKLPPCPIHFRSSVVNSFIGKGAKSRKMFSNAIKMNEVTVCQGKRVKRLSVSKAA